MQTDQQATNGILEDFRIEFLECWRRVPNKGFFLLLLAAWLALFHFLGNATLGYIRTPSLLTWMYISYAPQHAEGQVPIYDDGQGLVVPLLVLGLLWWKRKILLALPLRTWWPGLFVVAFGLFLHLAGFAVQQPRVSIVGLFTGLYGLMGLAWGPALLRAVFFPYWLFIFCVPFGSLAEVVTFPLRLLVCKLVEFVGHFILAIDVVRVGTQLFDPTGRYQYEVAAACSGIRSLVAIFLLATVYGFVGFRTPWKRLALMAAAFPLAVLGNLARMLVIIVAAEFGGQAAGDWAHNNTILSIIPYVPAIIGVLLAGRFLGDEPAERTCA